MFSSELFNSLRNVDRFIGVYSIDTFPHVNDGKMVINLDTSNLSGSHWVALDISKYYITYFDSFAHPIPIVILNKILIYNLKLYISRLPLQSYLETNCGEHCINFLKCNYPSPIANSTYFKCYIK